MPSILSFRMLFVAAVLFLTFASQILAQTPTNGTSTTATATAPPEVRPTGSTPPDVYLNVPELYVGRIELGVEELQADINLNAKVAGLVQVNAGVQLSVQKINVTIADVNVNLELIVRLGHLVDIVERVFESVDLNPLLIGLVNNVTNLVGDVIGAVDGLLGSITQGGTTLNFLIDNLGNIVQEVVGGAQGGVSTIVGNFRNNMTQVGDQKQVGQGLVQKTFSYEPLGALVDIVFNTAGQVVQAVVQKKQGGGGGSSSIVVPSSTAAPSSTATPVQLPVTSTGTA